MGKRILIIQGHPDPEGVHYGHALAEAYAGAAREAGHEVEILPVAKLEFGILRTQQEWTRGEAAPDIQKAQAAIARADHLVLIYPLWLGSMPALVKGFLEQTLRPGFAVGHPDKPGHYAKLLKGKSARIVVTMGMPAFIYRWFFRAHSLKSLERNVLKFCGIKPIRESLIGMVEGSAAHRENWLEKMRTLGRMAA
ncbi:NAD(P)H-dependent oxidoreductase [Thioalkalivibrio sulfidiphilus]|uniref:NAD(P)H-dependent oxidoreductase n=1 Tax=Thioalkalivibrio sulfidiphilus TaxID=1033854 RepID=UPI00037AC060|nr:NAD(P)H-dependent oxidoreductase [Thioalkalivibrio sulfidiphilus]